jgi:alpha-galactosidase
MIGTNLLRISDEVRSLLTNRNVIAIDQDWSGEQGKRIWRDGDRDIWAKQISDGGSAVVLLNRGRAKASFELNATTVNRDFELVLDAPTRVNLQLQPGSRIEVTARDAVLLRIS